MIGRCFPDSRFLPDDECVASQKGARRNAANGAISFQSALEFVRHLSPQFRHTPFDFESPGTTPTRASHRRRCLASSLSNCLRHRVLHGAWCVFSAIEKNPSATNPVCHRRCNCVVSASGRLGWRCLFSCFFSYLDCHDQATSVVNMMRAGQQSMRLRSVKSPPCPSMAATIQICFYSKLNRVV